jgi:uncharacterized protein YlzI (FlbEa/FlbD family)
MWVWLTDQDGREHLVNAEHIECATSCDHGTTVRFASGRTMLVSQSIDQIQWSTGLRVET